jgi:hypothetical protein
MNLHYIRTFINRLLLPALAFLLVASFATQTNQFFIQFRVTVIADSEAAIAIDNKMKSKSGIIESRTDYVTSTYFCILDAEAGYTREDFENWFGKMGYTITCYHQGLQSSDAMISPHVLKNCVEEGEQ